VICADVEPTDIVAHDDEDVGLPLLLRSCWDARHQHRDERSDKTKPKFFSDVHDRTPIAALIKNGT
jgi:hypothetical protein